MTREEAIEILENERPHCGEKAVYTEGERCEAYDMAISALRQQETVTNRNGLIVDDIVPSMTLDDAIAHLDDMEYSLALRIIERLLRAAPAVDAEVVVRCQDCLGYTPVDDNTGKCVFLIGEHQYVVPDGYCYLGERKEGADNDT